MRQANVERKTKETSVKAFVELDGKGSYNINTGIGFLDHMIEQLSRHSLINIKLAMLFYQALLISHQILEWDLQVHSQ